MQLQHHYDADVDTVFAALTDPAWMTGKYEALGAKDIQVVSHDDRGGAPRIVTKRTVAVDVPGFAKRVLSPNTTLVQTEEWDAPSGGARTCSIDIDAQGVPSRTSARLSLTPDGTGCLQQLEIEVKVSIPLLGGRLEKFAAESARTSANEEAAYTRDHVGT